MPIWWVFFGSIQVCLNFWNISILTNLLLRAAVRVSFQNDQAFFTNLAVEQEAKR